MGYLKFRESVLNRLLLKACKKNKLGLVKFFIFWGADKYVRFAEDRLIHEGIFYEEKTLIQIAYENNAFSVAKYLINTSNIWASELEKACIFGSLEIVRCLVERICSIDKTNIKKTNMSGYATPFMLACYYNREDIAKYLLDIKKSEFAIIDIDKVREEQKSNALMYACWNANLELIKSMLAQGVKIKEIVDGKKVIIKDYKGCTPLMYLFKTSQYRVNQDKDVEKIVDCLLEQEEDLLDCEDVFGKTALMYAIDSGNANLAKYLIEKGASLDIVDKDGNSILFYVIKNNMFDLLKYLVDKEIDLNHVNKFGKTILICAVEQKKIKMVRYLIEHGAVINLEDSGAKSALLYAIDNNDEEMIRCLVLNGVDIYRKYNSETSLMYAILYGNMNIVQLLIQVHLYKGEKKDDTYLIWENICRDNALTYAFKTKDKMLIDFLEDVYCKASKMSMKFIYEYENLFDLFDYINLDRGAISKVINDAGEVDLKNFLLNDIKLEDDEIKTIESIYNVIKNINKNTKEFIARGQKEYSFEPIKENKSDKNGNDTESKLKKYWNIFVKFVKKYWDKFKNILKFPYIKYKKLVDRLLIKACQKDDVGFLAKVALFFGADVNMKYEDYNVLIDMVCEAKNLKMLDFLIDKGLDLKKADAINKTAINYAIDSGNLDVFKKIMDRANKKEIADRTDDFGRTYLMYAARKGNVEIVKELIKIGGISSINQEDNWHNTVFMYACQNEDIIECLLESSDINVKNSVGESKLEEVIVCNFVESNVVKLFIEKGLYLSEDKRTLVLDCMFREALIKIRSKIIKNKSLREKTLDNNKEKLITRENISGGGVNKKVL